MKPQPSCLYPQENEIADLVLGRGRRDEWRALAQVLEREGFPPIDEFFGGRPWGKVEQWILARQNLVSVAPGRFGKQDGGETCPEPKKRRASSGAPEATVHRLPIGSRDRDS